MEMEMNIMTTYTTPAYTVPKSILVGDRVRYESAAGTIRGEVVDIDYAKNAAGDIIPWIVIQYDSYDRNGRSVKCEARLADTALAMMKFQVIFRDHDKKAA